MSNKIYPVYAQADDMTFIMEEKGNTISVIGFYFGEPDGESTEHYAGSLTAELAEDLEA